MAKRKLTPLQFERHRSRKASGRYLQLIEMVSSSWQFKSLSPRATKVFILLLARYNSRNNGDINIGRKEMSDIGFGQSGISFAEAIDELVDTGFVIVTRAGWYPHYCALYAVTTEPIDACPGKHDYPSEPAASHAWKKIARTEPVQGKALSQCNARRKDTPTRTEPVPVGAPSHEPQSTAPVPLCTGTNAPRVAAARALASVPTSNSGGDATSASDSAADLILEDIDHRSTRKKAANE